MTLDVANQIEKLAITVRRVSDLIPYAKNSRQHTPQSTDMLAKMIREFGWTNPVLLDGADGILAGHGRVMAAKKLGLKNVPCIDLSHLTEEQKQAYVIADNRSTELSSWDKETLPMELGELAEMGYDLTLTGWSQKALEELLGEGAFEHAPGDGIGDEDGDRAPEMVVPLMIEMPRALFQRWKAWRGKRSDLEALEAAIGAVEAA